MKNPKSIDVDSPTLAGGCISRLHDIGRDSENGLVIPLQSSKFRFECLEIVFFLLGQDW